MFALIVAVGLSACGRRGSLDRPKPSYPETKADPASKMSKAPDRRLWIDRLID
jgi:predicted small lipoprotein YifL